MAKDFPLLSRPLATPIHVRLLHFVLTGLIKMLFRIDVRGYDSVPKQGPYVLIANHISRFDPLLLLATFALRPRIWFLAAAIHTVDRPGRRRFLAWAGGIIPVYERSLESSRRVFQESEEVLQAGGVIGIFPEGQVGPEEGHLQPLHSGATTIALRTGVPILPVWIAGSQQVWWRKRIQIIIGEPFFPPAGVSRAASTAAMASHLQVLREQVEPLPEVGDPIGLWLNRIL